MAGTIESRLSALESAVAQLVALIGGSGAPEAEAPAAPARSKKVLADQETLTQLAGKLDELDKQLSEQEKAALLGILGAAAAKIEESADTEDVALNNGFQVITKGPVNRVNLGDALLSIGNISKGGPSTIGSEVADSIGVGVDALCVHGDWTKDLGSIGVDKVDPGSWSSGVLGAGGIGEIGLPGNIGGGFTRGPGG